MSRKGLLAAAGLACALAVPTPAGAATGALPVGTTQTRLALCPSGAPGITNPGGTAPSGCVEGGAATLCKDADVHAFVRTERMMDGKRPALAPVAGTVLVRLQSPNYGTNQNADTSADYGTVLAQVGALPPGSYEATATLWGGTATNPDGTTATYPGSTTSMTLVITDSPCSGSGATSTPAPSSNTTKAGCGLGDANHDHEAKAGKACPTK